VDNRRPKRVKTNSFISSGRMDTGFIIEGGKQTLTIVREVNRKQIRCMSVEPYFARFRRSVLLLSFESIQVGEFNLSTFP
jgi:hypothetical protein